MSGNRIISILVILALFAPAAVLKNNMRPVSNDPAAPSVSITIAPGAPLNQAAAQLKGANLIRSESSFIVFSRMTGKDRRMKSGTYDLSPSMPLKKIISILTTGGSNALCFTVPEGASIAGIAKILKKKNYAAADALAGATGMEAAYSRGIAADSLAGYLFPETYCASIDADADTLVGMMVSEFRKKLPAGAEDDAAALGMSLDKIVALASIIEKEASDPDERRLVSAVFHNRLKSGMPLQSCATVIYALGADYDGNLTKANLEIESPYNTYVHKGLPPGPISNPGVESIKAALHPAEADYLYFVSSNDGHHVFSSTYEEHLAAVHKYQAEPN